MKVAKSPIHRYFERSPQKVFRAAELNNLFLEHREPWRLPSYPNNRIEELLPHRWVQQD